MPPPPVEPVRRGGPAAYRPALDGLRGVAVAAVVLFHASWLTGGWAGVDIFFVLSGFLITTNLRRETEAGGFAFGRFAMRRVLRLTPALWALIAVVALIAPWRRQPAATWDAIALSLTYTMNWSRAFGLFPDDLLDHTWSLATEEQFYLLWPLAFLLIRRRGAAVWLGGATVLVVAWRCSLVARGAGYERTYCGFDTHADGLLLGCVLAVVDVRPAVADAARRFVAVPIVGLAFVFGFLRIDSVVTQTMGLSVTAALAAWLVIVACGRGRTVAVLSWMPLVFLGRISYGLYLWHFPLFILLRSKVPPALVPALIGVSLVLAILSYYGIERPFLRLKAAFEPTPASPKPAGAVT